MRSLTLLFLLLLFLWACGAQRRLDSTANLATEKTDVSQGRVIYKMMCDKCHPGGEAGVGLPVNNASLPGFLIRYRIRHRSFLLWMGKMPAFDKSEISGKEMDQLISYIKHLHHSKSEHLVSGR